MHRTRYKLLLLAALILSLAHHIDHIIRGNHVGWPVNNDINTFTFSLIIYPLVALGFLLNTTKYWLTLEVFGLLMITAVHFGPQAIEPIKDITGPHQHLVADVSAVLILVGLIVTLLLLALDSFRNLKSEKPIK